MRFVRLELKAVMQNDGDFVNLILLYRLLLCSLHSVGDTIVSFV